MHTNKEALRVAEDQKKANVIPIYQQGKKYPENCRVVIKNLTSWESDGANHPGNHFQTHES